MANFRSLRDDKNALCYIWLTLSLLILATVCFGLYSYQSYALYAGIVFLLLSTVAALLYFGHRCSSKQRTVSCCEAHCPSCCMCCYHGDCCQCFSDCCRMVLCLPPLERSHQRRLRRELTRRYSHRNAVNETHVVMMNHLGYEFTLPSHSHNTIQQRPLSSITTSKLRRIEDDIQKLFEQYSYLQTDATVTNSISADYDQLLCQHRLVSEWIESTHRPTERDVQQMKQTVKKISRNFRLARIRLEQDRSIRPDMTSALGGATGLPDQQCVIYATTLAGLPPYQPEDPLKTSPNNSGSETTDIPQSGELKQLPDVFSNTSRTTIDSRGSRISSRDTAMHFSGLASLPANTGSVFSLAPPEDETGAPPTYEEAVSTCV